MKLRSAGFIASMAILLTIAGCNQTDNENAANSNRAANANQAANANTASNNSNATVSTNSNSNKAPTREDYERDKERYQREAKEAGRTVGTGLNDGWLWVKVRYDLAAADDLRDSTINVDVESGVVTLTGSVASAAQKTKAEQVAKSAEGVKTVKSLLKVAANTSATPSANSNVNKSAPKTK
jgi:hyperosmotically inducible periplasmic protein